MADNIVFCNDMNVDNIITKPIKFSSTVLYPVHKNGDQEEPIICQTKYITLQNNATFGKKYSDDKKFIHIRRSLNKNDDPIDELFSFCGKLDNHFSNNKTSILEKTDSTEKDYIKLISSDIKKGYEYIKFKLNLFKQENDLYTRLFYKNGLFKDYKLADLSKALTTGCRLRFILHINKVWYNKYTYGLNIKVSQIEIDNTIINKFQIMSKLKDNNTNIFNETKSNDRLFDLMDKRSKFGMNKKDISINNGQIVNVLKESSTKPLFTDLDFAEAEACLDIDI
jgi:hypothetical protein